MNINQRIDFLFSFPFNEQVFGGTGNKSELKSAKMEKNDCTNSEQIILGKIHKVRNFEEHFF